MEESGNPPFFVWLLPRKFTKPCGIRPTAAAWGASLMPESRKNEIPHKCNFTKTVGKCFWLLIYFSSPWIYLSQKRNEILCHLQQNRSWTAAWSARKAVLSTSSQGLSETPSRQFHWVAKCFVLTKPWFSETESYYVTLNYPYLKLWSYCVSLSSSLGAPLAFASGPAVWQVKPCCDSGGFNLLLLFCSTQR